MRVNESADAERRLSARAEVQRGCDGANRQRAQDCCRGHHAPARAPSRSRLSADHGLATRRCRRGQRLDRQREVVRRREALRRLLLQAAPHHALERRRHARHRRRQVGRVRVQDRRHRVGGRCRAGTARAPTAARRARSRTRRCRRGGRTAGRAPARAPCSPPCPRSRPCSVDGASVDRRRLRRFGSGRVSFAIPKSRILTCPSFVTKTLAGFRSRWTIPFSCAAARPRAICTAMSTARRSGSRARDDLLAQRLALRAARRRDTARRRACRRRGARGCWGGRARPPRAPRARSGAGDPASAARPGGQDLDRDVASEPRVAGAVDLAHPACAELLEHPVWTHHRANHRVLPGLATTRPWTLS